MPHPLDTSSTQPPRPGLSPGAWAAISAIVVALIGAGVTLTTAWWSQHRAAATPAPASQGQSPPTAAPPAQGQGPGVKDLVGRWSGVAQGPDQPAQRIEVEILAGCGAGAACGWITVPDVPCRGRLSLVGPAAEGLEFQVDGFEPGSDPKVCQPGAGEVLRATGDGGVAYTATYSGAKGVLRPAR